MLVCMRCNGDDAIGAGHVGRCLPIADALRRVGHEPVFVGHYAGVARRLLERSSFPMTAATTDACGIPQEAESAVLDVYGLPAAAVAAAAVRRPTVVVRDRGAGGAVPVQALQLDYHLSSPVGTEPLRGPDFAPLDPAYVSARRPRRRGPVLVALGGSIAGSAIIEPLLDALEGRRVVLAGSLETARRDHVRAAGQLAGLHVAMAEAEAVVVGASVAAYEAACAGVAALLVVLVDNQAVVGDAFRPLTPVLDARATPSPREVVGAVRGLTASHLPAIGPALVDGYGAARVRDALLAYAVGVALPAPLRQRPARLEDADLLRAWRNDPEVRRVSRTPHAVGLEEHAAWLAAVLADPDRRLLVVEQAGEPVATVRFDHSGADSEISVSVARGRREAGLGSRVVREATELELAAHPGVRCVVARIDGRNVRSLRAFAAAGFVLEEAGAAWSVLTAHR